MTKYSIDDIEPELLTKITSTVVNAVNFDYSEAINAVDTETDNSKHFLLWDILNTPLIRNFASSNVLTSKQKRGLWELVLLFDTDSNTVFSFMKEYRIKQLRNRTNKKKAHYEDALVRLNLDLKAKNKQISMFGNNPDFEKQCEVILNDLCDDFKNESNSIKVHHVIIGFSNRGATLTSISAYLLDRDLDIVEQKSLDEYINLDFELTEIETVDDSIKESRLALTSKAKKVKIKNQNENNKVTK